MKKEQLLKHLETKGFPKKILGSFALVKREDFIPENLQGDSYEINSTPNLVMAEILAGEGEGHDFNEVDTTALKIKNKKWGYINFIGKDEHYPVRYFKPFYQLPKGEENSFAAAIVQQYNPAAYKTLQNRHKEIEIINYSRRQEQYT